MQAQEHFKVPYSHPIVADKQFEKSVAYFSMEFAIDQALKIYSGGLGFLAGSHMRSAYSLHQNLIGIGILWKYGYYDQVRNTDNTMSVLFREKPYFFLTDTKIRFQIPIAGKLVWVHTYYLAPEVFQSAPIFLLTTDTEGNDTDARSLSYKLYDNDVTKKIAQCMLLGIGGATLLDHLKYNPDLYHLNEAHALSAAFYLYKKYGETEAVKKRLVFTTHTPEEAGNEKHDIELLSNMGFFAGVGQSEVQEITGQGSVFNHTLAALRLAKKANGVSKLHGEVSRNMWGSFDKICEITHITNAQNKRFWVDQTLEEARKNKDLNAISHRKKILKQTLFRIVADQTGKCFDPDVLTIVWARRFAEYKRPDLLTWNKQRFEKIVNNKDQPVQLIWAGKPYPKDESAIKIFNELHFLSNFFPNVAVLTGYELALSKALKDGSDLWLNTPVVTREASGTSGMTAAMNGSLNCSTFDGWIPEFASNGVNAFILPVAKEGDVNGQDLYNLLDLLENEVIPTYYNEQEKWSRMTLQSMNDVSTFFDSDRMAAEYYENLYIH